MLYELKNVTQLEGEPKRRWFTNDSLDLIVWFNKENEIIGFQLCFNKDIDEQSFTWKYPSYFSLHKIDDGELNTGSKSTPTLVAGSITTNCIIADQFKENSKNIDRQISNFVYQKIIDYISNR